MSNCRTKKTGRFINCKRQRAAKRQCRDNGRFAVCGKSRQSRRRPHPTQIFAAKGRRARGRRASLIQRQDPKLYAKLEHLIQTVPWNWPDKAIDRLEDIQGTLMKAEARLQKQKGPAWGDLPLFRGAAPRDPDPEGELAGELFSLQEEAVNAIMEAQGMIDDGTAYEDPYGTSGEGSDEFTERMEDLVAELEGTLTGSGW